ncbi:MAG: hypothetical protein OXR66_05485 [Candidatus Woesearchaeota archaeon]|nr:hypothetical protein [Candidatus Woesearchaeota archaeon]
MTENSVDIFRDVSIGRELARFSGSGRTIRRDDFYHNARGKARFNDLLTLGDVADAIEAGMFGKTSISAEQVTAAFENHYTPRTSMLDLEALLFENCPTVYREASKAGNAPFVDIPEPPDGLHAFDWYKVQAFEPALSSHLHVHNGLKDRKLLHKLSERRISDALLPLLTYQGGGGDAARKSPATKASHHTVVRRENHPAGPGIPQGFAYDSDTFQVSIGPYALVDSSGIELVVGTQYYDGAIATHWQRFVEGIPSTKHHSIYPNRTLEIKRSEIINSSGVEVEILGKNVAPLLQAAIFNSVSETVIFPKGSGMGDADVDLFLERSEVEEGVLTIEEDHKIGVVYHCMGSIRRRPETGVVVRVNDNSTVLLTPYEIGSWAQVHRDSRLNKRGRYVETGDIVDLEKPFLHFDAMLMCDIRTTPVVAMPVQEAKILRAGYERAYLEETPKPIQNIGRVPKCWGSSIRGYVLGSRIERNS